jgi:hypothetical protein
VSVSKKGEVFVSDSRGHKIYLCYKGKIELFLDDPNLQNPNGVFVEKKRLIIASAGSGKIWTLDYKTKCLVPQLSGFSYFCIKTEKLWSKYYTAQPRLRLESERKYKRIQRI